MVITKLALDHFRSWDHLLIDLAAGVTVFQGANGLGKTNIVEAIEVLSTGSSHRVSSTTPLIERGQSVATIRANIVEDTDTEPEPASLSAHKSSEQTENLPQTTLELSLRLKGANRGRVNSGQSLYMRDIVGRIPSVTFAPDDQQLISAEPSRRRTFLDQACALLNREYVGLHQQFTKVARQRAALLKTLGSTDPADPRHSGALGTLEIWTGQFIALGMELTKQRAAVIELLNQPFSRLYTQLSNGNGVAGLSYEPSFAEVLEYEQPQPEISRHFQRLYAGESARGINLIGPQRDDMTVTIDSIPAKEFASNGEMWTLALALKMALVELVEQRFQTRPIVILDDVFAQLDENRRQKILEFASRQDQVFITVAAASDIPAISELDHEGAPIRVIDVEALKEGEAQ
ncbi:DNA replication/repair protein RecF [Bifidobacterium magnum]|uniref:DNA replication and repair protein RecF n=1 Tax=Bifidobacterium magnum TaxID=1692 RepID=A0A087B7Y2_9BIFI|nr:DNA replication and repair protein RecF [Bifidobacterium magnum]KFI67132.1 DNA replication and repair protein RecF [Bifidobacterium magnum]